MEVFKVVSTIVIGGILHYNGAQHEYFESFSHLITVNILFYVICYTIAYSAVSFVCGVFGKIGALLR